MQPNAGTPDVQKLVSDPVIATKDPAPTLAIVASHPAKAKSKTNDDRHNIAWAIIATVIIVVVLAVLAVYAYKKN